MWHIEYHERDLSRSSLRARRSGSWHDQPTRQFRRLETITRAISPPRALHRTDLPVRTKPLQTRSLGEPRPMLRSATIVPVIQKIIRSLTRGAVRRRRRVRKPDHARQTPSASCSPYYRGLGPIQFSSADDRRRLSSPHPARSAGWQSESTPSISLIWGSIYDHADCPFYFSFALLLSTFTFPFPFPTAVPPAGIEDLAARLVVPVAPANSRSSSRDHASRVARGYADHADGVCLGPYSAIAIRWGSARMAAKIVRIHPRYYDPCAAPRELGACGGRSLSRTAPLRCRRLPCPRW